MITVAISDAAPGRWQQAERSFELGLAGGSSVDGQAVLHLQAEFFGIKMLEISEEALLHQDCYITCKQCYIKMLEIDDQLANAWHCLFSMGGAQLGAVCDTMPNADL